MTPPPDIARRGLLTGAAAVAGAGVMGADHQAAPASAPPRTQRKTIDTNLGASAEQPSAMATPTDIRRTA